MSAQTQHRTDLLSVLLTDQQRRWSDGHRPPVEDYVDGHPGLADNRHALVGLIFAEASIRRALGETADLTEYQRRFPFHADTLGQQWDLAVAHPGVQTEVAAEQPSLPGYEVLAVLGHGGMGVAYRARQLGVGREVCVKLLFAHGRDPEGLRRFETEARALARLDHPGVVRVHDSGVHDGVPFLVMEFVPGGSLAERLKAGPLPAREAAALVRDAARAVQVVHDAGVVHRDLKPGNILLTADGAPKVADFGLARLLDGGGDLTEVGQTVGTPNYMSPEQARGDSRGAGPAADVWALGATLYAGLTGRAPFRGKSSLDVLARVQSAEPTPPRSVKADVPAALEAVCLKCLEKDPADRFASAGELADELERWLNGEPVRTRPPGWGRRLVRSLAPSAAPLSLLLLTGLAFSAATALSPQEGQTPAETEAERLAVQLRSGQGGDLFDARGRPRAPRLLVGREGSTLSAWKDGAFTVATSTYCLVGLARDPGRDTFEFRVDVRHHRSINNSTVGLFAAHRQVQAGPRSAHGFVVLRYTDRLDEGRAWDVMVANAGGRPPPHQLVRPLNRLYLSGFLYPGSGWADLGRLLGAPQMPQKFVPSLKEDGEWRTLRMRVRRDEVVGFWGEEKEPTCRMSVAAMLADLAKQGPELARDHPAKGVPFEYAPRGAVGVFVMAGVASFRNARVLP